MKLSAATRVLRLAFLERMPLAEVPTEHPLVDFVAYTHEVMLSGLLRLQADRLTDLLNAADELELIDVLSLEPDGRLVETARATIARADLVAVKASDPRGNARLRHRTREVPVAAGAGPYYIHGYLHGRPGTDPLVHLGRRPVMVPLTDATIGYKTPRGWQRDVASTLILNRDAAAWLRAAKEDELARFARLSGAA